MHIERNPELDATGLRVAVAVSRYHEDITSALCDGAVETFVAAGGGRDDLTIAPAAGAFELPSICAALADRDDVDGVVALGCVVRGETTHDEHICRAVASGLTEIAVRTGKPVGFGVLTCQTMHQARARAGGEKGNKGSETMAAVLETIGTLRRVREQG
jgi:6,7-dimethyl-8-ribityllumazine synthase